MSAELIRWVKIISLVWPLVWTISVLVFLIPFYRPLRRIVEEFNCSELLRIKIGPIEIVKRVPNKRKSKPRRKKDG